MEKTWFLLGQPVELVRQFFHDSSHWDYIYIYLESNN